MSPNYFQRYSADRRTVVSSIRSFTGFPCRHRQRRIRAAFLPAGAPLPKRIRLGAPDSPWNTIIGIVGDIRYAGLDHASDPLIYLPYSGKNGACAYLVLRSDQDPRNLSSAIRAQFAAVDSAQPVFGITTMKQRIDDSIETPRFNMTLSTLFASLALLLSAVGVYGVISYFVSQRTHEIGIRMALGAQPSDVVRLVISEGLVMILIGLAVGLAGSLFLGRYLANFLFEVRPVDPVTIVFVTLLLVLVSLLACFLPARRAAQVDPVVALRYQ